VTLWRQICQTDSHRGSGEQRGQVADPVKSFCGVAHAQHSKELCHKNTLRTKYTTSSGTGFTTAGGTTGILYRVNEVAETDLI
jgi:hypothetical protein